MKVFPYDPPGGSEREVFMNRKLCLMMASIVFSLSLLAAVICTVLLMTILVSSNVYAAENEEILAETADTGAAENSVYGKYKEKLADYKTDYIGDSVNVSKIAQNLPYPGRYSYSSIQIMSDEPPYVLIIYLSGGEGNAQVTEETAGEGDLSLTDCASLAFDLVGNLDQVVFRGAEEDHLIIESYNR